MSSNKKAAGLSRPLLTVYSFDCDQGLPIYISMVIGSSTNVLKAASHLAPVAPSTTR